MKKSKKKISLFVGFFLKKFFTNTIYPLFIFLRTYKNFKKKVFKNKEFYQFSNNLDQINKFEYKITSQNNEDGIIEYVFNKIPHNKSFVEIGFGYYEFNSLNLIKKGWSGKLIDIDLDESIALSKNLKYFFPESKVKIINKKITTENASKTIFSNLQYLDFFSIDIDSNDYWILKSLDLSKISLICCEYNHWLGNKKKITIKYNENFEFKDDGVWGASIKALDSLLSSKGFSLIAIESSGTNAFFINNNYSRIFDKLDSEKSYKSVGRFYSEERKKEIFENVKKSNALIDLE